MGGDPDGDSGGEKRLDLLEVGTDARLAHPVEAAALVGDVEQHDRDPGVGCRLGCCKGLRRAEVVELSDGGVACGAHLAVDVRVVLSDGVGRRAVGFLEHPVAPGPEVGARSPAAQRALERMTVAVDEAGQGDRGGHNRRRYHRLYACETMSEPTVSAPVRQIPNALTLIRFAAIPLFIWLLLDERSGPSWPAGIVFGLAAITDQLDGYLARRWHVESQFGKVADPLADRLMIDTAVVMLVAFDRLPWVALIILLRDLLLVGGYKLVVPRGYEFEVSRLGKIATWGLYASIGLVLVTEKGTWWPVACFWISLALAVVAAGQYVLKARRTVRP